MRIRDITGQVFGELTALRFMGRVNGSSIWLCRCSCGQEKGISLGCLIAKKGSRTVSCGHIQWKKKHGGVGTRLYHCWQSMKNRSDNKNFERYHRWGGRGIKIECASWYEFSTFRDWALSNGYADNLTLERKDNFKGYSPENCYWATPQQQANNTRRNVLLTAFGETKTVREWAHDSRCLINEAALYVRARQKRMSHHEMLTKPLRTFFVAQIPTQSVICSR